MFPRTEECEHQPQVSDKAARRGWEISSGAQPFSSGYLSIVIKRVNSDHSTTCKIFTHSISFGHNRYSNMGFTARKKEIYRNRNYIHV